MAAEHVLITGGSGFIGTAVVRGFALLARTAGLVGHLAEEMADPIGMRLWLDVEHRATYTARSGEP